MATTLDWLMNFQIFSCWLTSISSSETGFKALRKAKVPVSGAAISYFELLIHLLIACSLFYPLHYSFLLEVDPQNQMIDDPCHGEVQNFPEGGNDMKRLSALAVCSAILKYFGFSFDWISPLILGVWILIDDVKPDSFISKRNLHWLFVSLLPFYSSSPIILFSFLISYVHLWVLAPYFKNLVARSSLAALAYELRKFIEIVLGMLANAVAAYYFRSQSKDLWTAFSAFSHASLTLFMRLVPYTDFGVMQFLVTMSIQCAVSQFRLLNFQTLVTIIQGCSIMVWKTLFEVRYSLEGPQPIVWRGKKVSPIRLPETIAYVIYHYSTYDFFRKITLEEGSGRINSLLLWSFGAVQLMIWRRIFLQAMKGICPSFLIYWHGIYNSINQSSPFYYIRFRYTLHLFVRHMHHHNHNHELHGNRAMTA